VSPTPGFGGWSHTELEFAQDTHAVRALWAAAPKAVALAPPRIRDELAAQAAETAASYTARLQSSDRSSPNVDGEPHPAATNSGGGDRKAK